MDIRNCGIYGWWRKCCFGADKTSGFLMNEEYSEKCSYVGSKIFAIECFPYHSKKFSMGLIQKTKYYDFWCRLVLWAISNKKSRDEYLKEVLSLNE
jgi:hypothetical protein